MGDAAAIAAITGTTSATIAWIGYLNSRRQARVALETNERQATAALETAQRQADVELAKVNAETERMREAYRRDHAIDLRRLFLHYLNAVDAHTSAAHKAQLLIDDRRRAFHAARHDLTDTLNEIQLVAPRDVAESAVLFEREWLATLLGNMPAEISAAWREKGQDDASFFAAWDEALAATRDERLEQWQRLLAVLRTELARAEGRS